MAAAMGPKAHLKDWESLLCGRLQKIMGKEIKLGFGCIPVPQYIFIGGKDEHGDDVVGHLWYAMDYKTMPYTKIPIPDQALTGYITGLRMTNKPYKGKDAVKVDISISAERKYVIRTGIETIFARGLFLALALFDTIKDVPVTICVTPGSEKNVIYSSLFRAETEEPVKFDWDKSKALSPIINKLQEQLGQEPQDPKQVLIDGRPKN